MSPRQTRAGVTRQSAITTRARAQKLNDAQVSAKSMEKIKRSHKREKSLDIRSDIEANTEQIAKRELSDTNVRLSKSTKKKVSRRTVKLAKKVEDKDEDIAHEIGSVGSNKPNKLLRERHSNSTLAMEHTENNSVRLSGSKDSDWDKTPKRLQENAVLSIKISPCMITPKSTPIKLNLTPHRSTKTPKKSPVSLGSPKTRSIATPKLIKSPRKLSLSSWDNLNKLGSCNSIIQKTKHNRSNTSISDKSLSTSPVRSKRSKSGVNLKKIVRKFSKSPKIVLRSPKSKKSKSPKLKLLSPSRIKRSPLKRSAYSIFNTSDLNTAKPIRTSTRKSPSPKSKNALTIKRPLLNPRLMKVLTDSQIKDILAEPVVLLERLSSKNMQTMLMTVRKNLPDISIGAENSCKVLTPIARKTSVELDAFTYLGNTQRNPTTKLLKRSASRLSLSTIQNSLIEGKKRSVPLKASTPREEKTPIKEINTTFDTPIISTDDASPNTRSRYKNQFNVHTMRLSSMANKSMTTEKESKSSLFNTSGSNLNRTSTVTKRTVTYNVNEGTTSETESENGKDTTYELIEPQTPNLQWLIKKRTATEANLSAKEDIKRTCKVRFANLTSDNSNLRKSINKLNRLQSNMSHNNSRQMDTPRPNRNSLISSAKSKSSTVINRITPKSQVVRRSQSFNNMISNLSSNKIQTTPKTFASAEKKSEKKSSIKKVPNFSRIHEKMFAKSESLIDVKKRLENRHQAFATSKILPKVDAKKEIKPLPSDTNSSAYNRFGFKLRKAEATHVMLKKQTVFSRQKQQHETRMVLKGVRTNRRFELQMKSRNLSA